MNVTDFFRTHPINKLLANLCFGLYLVLMVDYAHGQTLPPSIGNQELPSLAPIIDQVAPAVVNISVQGSVEGGNAFSQSPEWRRFFPPNNRREVQSAGSGVIVDAANGYILTNNHVIENADEITVALIDDRTLNATVVGSDAGSDIAVLQVAPDDLSEMPLGNSEGLRVGDFVLAIGNPFRLRHTVTSGIVSGLGRTGINPEGYEDFIQTDASINPGNSGGALVNLRGELVGINTAIFSRTGGNIGIGFAIPVNMARTIMDQIVAFGGVRRGLLGVSIATVTPEIADSYDLDSTSGALVTVVASDSAAEAAGLQIGDVIVSVDGNPVEDPGGLRNVIGLMRPGDEVTVGYVREGNQRTVTAALGELQPPGVEPAQPTQLAEIDPVFEGAEFATNDESRADFNGLGGVLATLVEPGSTAFLRGLRTGDIITHINRQRVRSVDAAQEIVEGARSVILQVSRRNRGVLILMR
ncbi:MAG: Do family serine endopeptidase [Pseudomonadota bacterium]|nr:Do family serine endopeptidase [Pseudomonadota bacterium]